MSARTPLPKICVAMGFPDAENLLQHARRELQEGERFLEFRLDYLPDPYAGVDALGKLQRENPEAIVLATCRRHQNHGHYNGSIQEQVRVLEAAAAAGAKAVDLEIESAEKAFSALAELRAASFFIVSYHNFESTPMMEPVLRRMARVPADAYKVVTTARKPSDVMRVLGAGKLQPRTKTVLLSMGEAGFPARILSACFGSLYTYAAPSASDGTAPGQVCAKVLRSLYRVEKLSKSSKVFGVIADPVRHSISPAVHNRAFQAKRLDAVYVPFLVAPTQLKDFMDVAEKLPVQGFSVTIPHKQRILRYLDHVDPLARRIGAVNTVWRKAGKWRGGNTDVFGVTGPLARRVKLRGASVLIAGNGGAARGAAFALTDAGAKVTLTGRNADRVRTLAKAAGVEAVRDEQALARHFDVFINATSLGMYPHSDECYFRDTIPAEVVFDMVYNPLETLLTQRAKEQRKQVILGKEMFLEQAAHQFEIWTGEQAPRAVMEKAALEALGHKQ